MFQPKHIVCAVDLSIHTGIILRWGECLAQLFGARATVFHAVNAIRQDPYPGTTIFERGGQLADLLSRSRRWLVDATAPFGKINAQHVAAGDAVETLVEFSRSAPADLVVAASHGLSGIQRVFLGTVVERLARQLETPLLVVRATDDVPPQRPEFKRIVAACDFPSVLGETVACAAAFARRFDAALYLFHAMEAPVNTDVVDPTEGPYGEVQAELQKREYQHLAEMTAAEGFEAKEVRVDLRPGPAPEILPKYIREVQADLAVVGVRPRRRLTKFIVGSTTEAVLRHAPCAILTVPPTTSA